MKQLGFVILLADAAPARWEEDAGRAKLECARELCRRLCHSIDREWAAKQGIASDDGARKPSQIRLSQHAPGMACGGDSFRHRVWSVAAGCRIRRMSRIVAAAALGQNSDALLIQSNGQRRFRRPHMKTHVKSLLAVLLIADALFTLRFCDRPFATMDRAVQGGVGLL
jgi:hypothetical protein